ncbi:dephospho-CoA kinase [bacterium endosymbiont of Pedicinus badii]|uniref:dephospho-CoA kinase n=1 Tax=bacterium endosymbiont of Pedicinus badii TaxID=1719126 RepID=UPI0009BA3451|nr:dephospho-CoA kinase [bacterium endosymbiont of Pedicinus badii]OQM34227.1 hypothetical protein AOQ89_02745 [bacterium endosymbiont of Pedicinus badii]
MSSNKKYIVAITGGIGSGKTTVAKEFFNLGVPIVDSDEIAKDILNTNFYYFSEIVKRYGKKVISYKNSTCLNRDKLKKIIFSEKKEVLWINDLMQEEIMQRTKKLFSKSFFYYLVWVVPLLIELNLYRIPNRIIVVDTSYKTQISRTKNRNPEIQKEIIKNIIFLQSDRDHRISLANEIIDNEKNKKKITSCVRNLHNKYVNFLKFSKKI